MLDLIRVFSVSSCARTEWKHGKATTMMTTEEIATDRCAEMCGFLNVRAIFKRILNVPTSSPKIRLLHDYTYCFDTHTPTHKRYRINLHIIYQSAHAHAVIMYLCEHAGDQKCIDIEYNLWVQVGACKAATARPDLRIKNVFVFNDALVYSDLHASSQHMLSTRHTRLHNFSYQPGKNARCRCSNKRGR